MAEREFTTSDSGKEFPARFGGIVVRYSVPDVVPGDLDATIENLKGVIHPDADPATVIGGRFNGQGYDLEMQKRAKSFLGREEGEKGAKKSVHADKTVEQVTEELFAYVASDDCRLLKNPPVAGEGAGSKAKAELAAEKAKVAALTDSVKETYLDLPANHRAKMRAKLLGRGAPYTEELLAGWDSEAA